MVCLSAFRPLSGAYIRRAVAAAVCACFELQNRIDGHNVHATSWQTFSIEPVEGGLKAVFSGVASVRDASGTTEQEPILVEVVDLGEPGTRDELAVEYGLGTTRRLEGTVTNGNIQVRREAGGR